VGEAISSPALVACFLEAFSSSFAGEVVLLGTSFTAGLVFLVSFAWLLVFVI